MAVTGGYQPGTYQAADLNRLQSVFGTAGIARGMSVTQTSPTGLSVYVTVDGTKLDGVCYLPNGGWVRIDAQLTLSVPTNASGLTRNDAVVATMDPTAILGPATVAYITNWAGGFAGGTSNQLVLALVAVPNGAASVLNSNITVSTAAASFGSANTAGNLLPNAQVQTTATSTYLVMNVTSSGYLEWDVTTQSGTVRGLVLTGVNAAGTVNQGLRVNNDGTVVFPHNVSAGTLSANVTGTLAGNVQSDNGGSIFLKLNTTGTRVYVQGSTSGPAYNKYDILILLPFN